MDKVYEGATLYAKLGNKRVKHHISDSISIGQCRKVVVPLIESLNEAFGEDGFESYIKYKFHNIKDNSTELKLF